ncbi:hypothetical protein [Musicola keenii]|uniref:hypothetical protein n=1 Tax=Musicola keenii TaxID=2884250 RepID=UPI0017856C2B|nr:hypothetical protein [Musicola keenii]
MFSKLIPVKLLTLIKPDGTIIDGIKGNVQPGNIFVNKGDFTIEQDDILIVHDSDGESERYVVVNPNFFQGEGQLIPPNYQCDVKICNF